MKCACEIAQTTDWHDYRRLFVIWLSFWCLVGQIAPKNAAIGSETIDIENVRQRG